MRRGLLHRVLPRVYALGHLAPSVEGDLFAAVLYAGPGAMLSHITAGWWRGLLMYPAAEIHVSTPRDVDSQPGIVVHGRRALERELVQGIPATTIEQTALDVAATGEEELVRRLLGQLDYRHALDIGALRAACGHGRPGSELLRRVMAIHDPGFGRVNGRLEYLFLGKCQRWRVEPLPVIDQRIAGVQIDALWPEHRFVVQLDGEGNHHSFAQRRRDMRDDLIVRREGFHVVRYDWVLVERNGPLVRDEVNRVLTNRR